MSGPDKYILVYDLEGASAWVRPEDEGTLDARVTAFLDSGGTRDSLIDLTLMNGDPYRIRASQVSSWIMRSRAGRRRQVELEKEMAEEDAATKKELGIWEEPE